MSVDPRLESAQVVAAYVRALRTRATVLYGLRSLCAALGVAGVYIVVVGGLSGPVVTPLLSQLLLTLLAVIAAAVLGAGLWPVQTFRGTGGCQLLARRAPVLASRVRTALELREAPPAHGSPALVAAHAQAVREEVARLPAAEVVPLAWLRQRAVFLGIGAALASMLALVSNDTLRGGARALLHPAEVRADGLRVAAVVASTHARLIYPSYLNTPSHEMFDPRAIEVPRGTTIELAVRPRLNAQRGTLAQGNARVSLTASADGKLFARFVAHESGALVLRLASGGHFYEDSLARRVKILEDLKPSAELHAPEGTRTVDLRDAVPLRWKASDDHGLSSVDLVVRAQDGQEQRRRLWSPVDASRPRRSLEDEVAFVPAEIGAQPGDVLLVWLEARDGDIVSGPNVGASRSLTLEIATDAEELSLRLPLLREVLDGALSSLADRLETPLPEQTQFAEQRFQELREGSQGWLMGLSQLIAAARQRKHERALDLEQLQGVLDRTRRELGREAGMYAGGNHSAKQRTESDARMVAEQEKDTLLLSDMLAQGLVDEARNLTSELSELKNHIAELLKELKAHKTPEAERALLSEIAKAERRLRELAQSLARLSNRVPSEFINREALPQNDAKSSLDKLQAAVEAGDLNDAEHQLQALADQIAELSEHIENGGARFRESHFGARDQAIAQADRQVSALAAEQARLAGRSHDLLRHAAERAKGQAAGAGPSADMQRAADELERDLQAMQESDQSSPESAWLDRARARLRDAADAMRTGDMAEARGMSGAASSSLEQAASGLEAEARAFPGPGGAARRRAEAAGAAAAKMRKLERQIDQATPQLGQYIGEPERNQMRGDLDPQQKLRQQADGLQSELGRGPDGTPLSPDGERGLQQASEAMRRAERALEHGDPQGASLAQEDASERLRQLEDRLKQKNDRNGGGGQQSAARGREGGRDGDGLGQRSDGQVRIPGADEFNGPVQMRRRLLDAMREQPPSEYKSAVERYYEELLR